MQYLFAEVKRKHQENHRKWRHGLAEYLLWVEAMHPKPPMLSEEYKKVSCSFQIPFKTAEYQNWVSFMMTASAILHSFSFEN